MRIFLTVISILFSITCLSQQGKNLKTAQSAIGVYTTAIQDTNKANTLNSLCQDDYYFKTFTNSNNPATIFDMVITETNDVILVGEISNSVESDRANGFILRLDKNGNKMWEIGLSGESHQYFTRIIKLRDKNYLVTGLDDWNWFMLKIDDAGKTIWRKEILADQVNNNPGIQHLVEDEAGNIYMGSFHSVNLTSGMLFIKCDNSGNFIYSKHFLPSNVLLPWGLRDMVIKDGYTYAIGWHIEEGTNSYRGFLSKIENSSGNLKWTKTYKFNNSEESFFQVFDYSPTELCILGEKTINASDTNSIVICDTSGTVRHVSYFQYGLYRQFGRATMDGSGNILYANYHTNGSIFDLAICVVNPFIGVQWARRYPQVTDIPRVARILYDGEGNIYCSGQFFPGKKVLFLEKFNSIGENGCPSVVLPMNFGKAMSSFTGYSFNPVDRTFRTVSASPPVVSDYINEESFLCKLPNTCNALDLQIIGSDTLCNLSDTLKILVKKNSGCLSQPQFTYDATRINLSAYRGDTAFFVLKASGKIEIRSKLNACDVLADSISIHVFNGPSQLLSSSDTTLCPGNILVLHANPSFSNYRWQDGSIDSVLTVTTPGTYIVEASDGCGRIYRDTIIVSSSPEIPFTVGANRLKCNDDTLSIQAPDGFINYVWTNSQNVDTLRTKEVILNPAADINYYVSAENSSGCYAYDTIGITVKRSPPITLGKDTSICENDSVTFRVGDGFISYLWNTGSTMQEMKTGSAGVYSVSAKTADGCQSNDTIAVLDVFSTPVIGLNHDPVLCVGQERILDAGDFETYQWNTGATSRYISLKDKGKYSVTVTDINGCTNADSTIITSIAVPPANFLPADTSICSYQSVIFKAKANFRRYLWSTNSSGPSIEVRQPGIYWLHVTDNNGCSGRDTIHVKPLDCTKGIFFPTAFTPNDDRRNDTFKPLVSGNLVNYQFAVYNRWGQIIFQTTKINEGWPGKVAGQPQHNNTFVWTCIYQFEGEELKHAKGTVTLIR